MLKDKKNTTQLKLLKFSFSELMSVVGLRKLYKDFINFLQQQNNNLAILLQQYRQGVDFVELSYSDFIIKSVS